MNRFVSIYIDIFECFYIIHRMNDPQRTATILKSLADDTRLAIVRKLASDDCEVPSDQIVSSCATFHKLSQPTMSHHFGKLVASGVIAERKSGLAKSYRLNRELLSSIGIDADKL